jgi:hypothetical protein
LEFLTTAKSQQEEIKGIQIDKEVVTLFLFTDDMNLIPRRPEKLYPKILRHHNQLQQSGRIMIQFTKTSSLSIHQQ